MRRTGLAIIGYGALAALVLACLWLVSLAPLRLGWGRELVGAAIAVVALVVGLKLSQRQQPDQASIDAQALPAGDASSNAAATASAAATTTSTAPPELSGREREVLRWLAEGLSNKEIARALCVSENTVKTHLANLYAKLGVGRRTEALKVARQRGWC